MNHAVWWDDDLLREIEDSNWISKWDPATSALVRLLTAEGADPQYRLAIAWQNVGYNQPPHPSFFLGEGMSPPPAPPIVHADTTPPAFKTLAASETVLWRPRHQMVPITIAAEAVDLLDPAPTVRVVEVTSSEPVDGEDDGNTSPDWEITGPLSVLLRAERSGIGTGRVYTISVEARDASGNTTVNIVTVTVPLSRD